jgi:hypothetical protein
MALFLFGFALGSIATIAALKAMSEGKLVVLRNFLEALLG